MEEKDRKLNPEELEQSAGGTSWNDIKIDISELLTDPICAAQGHDWQSDGMLNLNSKGMIVMKRTCSRCNKVSYCKMTNGIQTQEISEDEYYSYMNCL